MEVKIALPKQGLKEEKQDEWSVFDVFDLNFPWLLWC